MDNQLSGILRQLHRGHLMVLDVCCERYPDRSFCGRWLRDECIRRGVPFHQGWLGKLTSVGLLMKEDSSRGGNRRYYRIAHIGLARRISESVKRLV